MSLAGEAEQTGRGAVAQERMDVLLGLFDRAAVIGLRMQDQRGGAHLIGGGERALVHHTCHPSGYAAPV